MNNENMILKAEEFITDLFSMYKIHFLYSEDHPQYTNAVEPAFNAIGDILKEENEAKFLIVDREFIFSGEPLLRSRPMVREFAEIFEEREIERMNIVKGVTKEDLTILVELLAMKCSQIEEEGFIEDVGIRRGMKHILLESISSISNLEDISAGFGGEGESIFTELPLTVRKPYANLYENTRIIMNDLASGRSVDLSIFRKQVEHALDEILDRIDDFVDAFHRKDLAFGKRDHEVNISLLTAAFARYLGFDRSLIEEMCTAAIFHDIGKSLLPEEIRNKPPNRLKAEEADQYRHHPLMGAELLLLMENVPPLAIIAAYEHHTGWKSEGYQALPAGLKPHPASLIIGLLNRYERTVRMAAPGESPRNYVREIYKLRGTFCPVEIFDLFAAYVSG